MSDEDIVEMLSRIWVYSEDGTTQDMNGKIWNPDKDNAVDLQEFRDCEGMSAKEIFEAHGRQNSLMEDVCGLMSHRQHRRKDI